jgi:hypothetical protein
MFKKKKKTAPSLVARSCAGLIHASPAKLQQQGHAPSRAATAGAGSVPLRHPWADAGARTAPLPARQQQPAWAAAPGQPEPRAAGQPPWRGPLLEARQRGPAAPVGSSPPGPSAASRSRGAGAPALAAATAAAVPSQPSLAPPAGAKLGPRPIPQEVLPPPAAAAAQPEGQQPARRGEPGEPSAQASPPRLLLPTAPAALPAGQGRPVPAAPSRATPAAPADTAPAPQSGPEGPPSEASPVATPAPPQGTCQPRRRQPPDGATAASRAARRDKRQASLEMWGSDDHRDLAGDRRERSESGSDALPARRRQRPGEWWISAPRPPLGPVPSQPSVPPRGPPRRPPCKSGKSLPQDQQPCHSRSRKSRPSMSRAAPSCQPAAGEAK